MYNDIYKCIEYIRTRPGMFLEKKSVYNLSMFILGYKFALRNNTGHDGIKEGNLSFEPLPFFLFDSFVANQYNESACMGWCGIILLQTNEDEEKGLDLFFQLLDKFRAIKILHCQMAALTPENIEYHNTSDKIPKQIIIDNNQFNTISMTAEKNGNSSSSEQFDFDKMPKIPVYINAQNVYCIQLTDDNGYLFVIEYHDALCCEFLTLSKDEILEYTEKCFGKVEWQSVDSAIFQNKPIYNARKILDVEGNYTYW